MQEVYCFLAILFLFSFLATLIFLSAATLSERVFKTNCFIEIVSPVRFLSAICQNPYIKAVINAPIAINKNANNVHPQAPAQP